MATTIDVNVLIRARDEASKALESFGHTAQSVGGKVGGFFADNFKKAGLASAGLLAAMGAVGAKMVGVASTFEQNRVAFETMLGSADKARVLLQQISDFAAKTPFELPQVAEGAKQLLALGGSAENVLPHLKAIGDVAAGTGAPLDRLILNFGQVRLQGKLTGRELRDFAVSGVPLIDELAKNLGVAKDQIAEMVSAGKIGFPEVEKAFMTMTGAGGKFNDLMTKQSKTFGGILSNVRDNFTRFAAEVVGITAGGDIREGSLFFYLKQGAEKFLQVLEVIRGPLISFVQTLLGNKEAVIAIAGAIGGLLVLAIGALVIFMAPLIAMMIAFAAAGAVLALIVSKLVSVFMEWLPAIQAVWTNVTTFFSQLPAFIGNIITQVIDWFQQLPTRVIEFLTHLFFEWIPFAIGFIAGFLLEAIPRLITNVINWFEQLPGRVMAVFTKVKDNIINLLTAAWSWVKTEVPTWPGKIEAFIKSIPGIVGKIFTAAKDKVLEIMESMWNGVMGWWDKIKGILEGIINLAQGAINKVREGFEAGKRMGGGKQTGGIIPGAVGEPRMVLAHGGEEIVPAARVSAGAGAGIAFNVYLGLYAGTETEKRNIAAELYSSLVQVASTQNKTVAELLGG